MKKIFITLLVIAVSALNAFAAPRWQQTDLNVYIKDNPKAYIMKRAFNKWQSVTNDKVTFDYVTDKANADITVEYIENLPNLAVGLCIRNYKDGNIVKAKIFLARRNKYKTILTNDEYFRIMLHEIGHALGLQHSTDLNSIMRPTTLQITNISIQDRKDLNELYK